MRKGVVHNGAFLLPVEFRMPKNTVTSLLSMKGRREKIAMLAVYDATFAHAASQAGVEVLLIGDSLGMVSQGRSTTLPVTIEDIAYHTRCVGAGNTNALIVADLPFCSTSSFNRTLEDAVKVMQAGAEMVKIEGGEWLSKVVAQLLQMGIPSCAHLGLTPQAVNVFGGFKVQGRDDLKARQLREDALILAEAGAAMLVLECVPAALAQQIADSVDIPVIGIGAGAETDGQVLVMHDMLGLALTGRSPKFVKNFLEGESNIQAAFSRYVREVKDAVFPRVEHQFS